MENFQPHNDLPLLELQRQVNDLVKQGHVFYMKFTCSSCGARLMLEEPNTLYTEGICDECGHVTDITETGAGFALLMATTTEGKERMKRMVAESHAQMGAVTHPSGTVHTPDMALYCSECIARN